MIAMAESVFDITFAREVPEGDRDQIRALLASCDAMPLQGPAQVACLVGGANNRNYVVSDGQRRVVARIANPAAERFAVDRVSATQGQRDAAAVGLAPQVLGAQLPEGHTLSEFLDGVTLRESSLTDVGVVRAIGDTLARLHASETTMTREFSAFRDVRKWAQLARDDGTELPSDLDDLLARCERVEAAVVAADLPRVFCHNDTVPQNFLYDGTTARLVDWDYAGVGWAAFELASFAATAQFGPELRAELTDAYCGGPTAAQEASLDALAFVAAMRELTWALMATPVLKGMTTPPEGWSYEDYLADNLALARRMAANPAFDQLLEQMSSEPGRSW